jgi:hypothetical protein
MTDNSNPTFTARFVDGQVTVMTVFSSLKKLDVMRGVRLAQHAYRSRTKCEPPAIVEAHFENDGAQLASYDAETLEEIGSRSTSTRSLP